MRHHAVNFRHDLVFTDCKIHRDHLHHQWQQLQSPNPPSLSQLFPKFPIGKPEMVITESVKAVGAEVVYTHKEVSFDEVKGGREDMPMKYGGFREKVKGLKIRKTIEALDQLRRLPAGGDVEPGEIRLWFIWV
ncbi:hypothetical protein Hanom_Chr06g00533961 [Helianthus anomalus]